jgi:uncharacterized repeat protein (TIGR01451 family)
MRRLCSSAILILLCTGAFYFVPFATPAKNPNPVPEPEPVAQAPSAPAIEPQSTDRPGVAQDLLRRIDTSPGANAPRLPEIVGNSPTSSIIPTGSEHHSVDAPIDFSTAPLANVNDGPVVLHWLGSNRAQVGLSTDYTLVVRNTCNASVQNVIVHVRLGAGIAVGATRPSSRTDNGAVEWQLGTLLPKQEKRLEMSLTAGMKGDMSPKAFVTYIGASTAPLRLHAYDAHLAVKASGPQKIIVGDSAAFSLTVNNTGDGPAEQVQMHALLPDGLEHPQGKRVRFDLGNLGAGESRTVQVVCMARAGGTQRLVAEATARGGMHVENPCEVAVITPELELKATGPGLRYVDRKATYRLEVTNRGSVGAGNVSMQGKIPDGFRFVTATDGGYYNGDTRTVAWFLGEVAPGQSRTVQFEALPLRVGEFHYKFSALTERGSRLGVERELVTRVEDLSALTLEVADTEDPVEVGKETVYEVIVTNAGSRTETDIKLVCVVPDKLELESAGGSVRYHAEGKVILFEPITRLAPRGEAVFKIKTKAVSPGEARFKAQVTSTDVAEPIIKMEATRVYSDQP